MPFTFLSWFEKNPFQYDEHILNTCITKNGECPYKTVSKIPHRSQKHLLNLQSIIHKTELMLQNLHYEKTICPEQNI